MLHLLIIAGFVILIISVLVVLVSPTRTCPRCQGERVSRSRTTGRLMGCPRCKGTGETYRRGATLLHRLRWSVREELDDQKKERQS